MFQLFHADVAKVDRDVADVVMVVHVCCKRLSPMFHLFFIHVCCKCFRCMSQSVSSVFFCVLRVSHRDVLKVDRNIALVTMMFQLYASNDLSMLDVYYKSFI